MLPIHLTNLQGGNMVYIQEAISKVVLENNNTQKKIEQLNELKY